MIAINEVTKKQVFSIDLRKAEAVVDLNAKEDVVGSSPKTTATSRNRGRLSDEVLGGAERPRSFRIEFSSGEGIMFGCDKEEDKVAWSVSPLHMICVSMRLTRFYF
jgi:serine/arginine repetitive matrix protein 2